MILIIIESCEIVGGGGSIRCVILSHGDFDIIISLENLLKAWKEFRRGKMKKPDVSAFDFDLERNLITIRDVLISKEYSPGTYEEFFVCDPKRRKIHKATVADRVLHQAVYRELYQVFDKGFIHDSYSCRLNKGTHAGARRLESFAKIASANYKKELWYLKCDITKFFDNIDHSILRGIITTSVTDENTLWLVDKILHSFEKSAGKGLPLGNVTSQLFANIYMNEFDQFVKHNLRAKHYLRYCDDFIILNINKNELIQSLEKIKYFLENRLGLCMHPDKIFLNKFSNGIDFLGFVVFPWHKIVRTKTKNRIFRKLEKDPNPASVQSYVGITKHAFANKIRKKLVQIPKGLKPS